MAKNEGKSKASDVNDRLLNDGDDVENIVSMQETNVSENSESRATDHGSTQSSVGHDQGVHPSDAKKPVCHDDEGWNLELSSVRLDSVQFGTHVVPSRIQNQHEVQSSADQNTRENTSAMLNTRQKNPYPLRLVQSSVGPDIVNHDQCIFPYSGVTGSAKPLSHDEAGRTLKRQLRSGVGPDIINHDQRVFPCSGITGSMKPLSHDEAGWTLERHFRSVQSSVGPDIINHDERIFPCNGVTDSRKPVSHDDAGWTLERSSAVWNSIQFGSQIGSLRISNPVVACSDKNSSDYASAVLDTGQASASSSDTGYTSGISRECWETELPLTSSSCVRKRCMSAQNR